MKVITNLYHLEKDLAERLGSVEMAQEIIKDYSVEIYHAWSNEDIAATALEMVEKSKTTDIDITDIEKYRDELIEFLIGSEEFNIEAVGDKFADASNEVGISWDTIEWAIVEIHTIDDLIKIVQEAITEAKNNDTNPE